jgi:hypothetical protein
MKELFDLIPDLPLQLVPAPLLLHFVDEAGQRRPLGRSFGASCL